MKARDMFEKLGYTRNLDSKKLIYAKELKGMFRYLEITFDLTEKEVELYDDHEAYTINRALLKAILKQVNELGWLEEEKQKTREETNFEHYFEYLSEKRMMDFALINGRVTKCSVTQCSECDFNGDCIEGKFRWLKQPYKKLPYKLSQFEFDIIQTYRDCHESCKISEFKQLIELKDKGYFKCIDHDTKIQDVLKNCEVIE